MKFSEKYKPAVTKKTLLFFTGCVWLIGGGILISKARMTLVEIDHILSFELFSGLILGICFYIFLFTKISKKHITRISLIMADFPCFFPFFNFRSYIIMAIMIFAVIILRRSHIFDFEYLYSFYLAMGIPLLLSAFRFFIAGIKNTIKV